MTVSGVEFASLCGPYAFRGLTQGGSARTVEAKFGHNRSRDNRTPSRDGKPQRNSKPWEPRHLFKGAIKVYHVLAINCNRRQ